MNARSKLFVDTGAFVALTNPRDQYHDAATAFYRSLAPTNRRLTSWGVISETYTWLRYHLDQRRAARWILLIEEADRLGDLEILYPDPDLDRQTRRLLLRYDDQKLSYVDGLTLAILESRADIDGVFAFDHHLALSRRLILPSGP